jgi:hypothetical protein
MTEWETVEVPKGAYIGWGNKAGQHLTGKVLAYEPVGGTDFYNEPCPQVAIELTEEAWSFNKDGDRTKFDAGELVQLNAGQVSLKRALRAADPSPGDLVKITLENIQPLKGGKTVKEFGIKIARGAGGPVTPKPKADDGWGTSDDDSPPF